MPSLRARNFPIRRRRPGPSAWLRGRGRAMGCPRVGPASRWARGGCALSGGLRLVSWRGPLVRASVSMFVRLIHWTNRIPPQVSAQDPVLPPQLAPQGGPSWAPRYPPNPPPPPLRTGLAGLEGSSLPGHRLLQPSPPPSALLQPQETQRPSAPRQATAPPGAPHPPWSPRGVFTDPGAELLPDPLPPNLSASRSCPRGPGGGRGRRPWGCSLKSRWRHGRGEWLSALRAPLLCLPPAPPPSAAQAQSSCSRTWGPARRVAYVRTKEGARERAGGGRLCCVTAPLGAPQGTGLQAQLGPPTQEEGTLSTGVGGLSEGSALQQTPSSGSVTRRSPGADPGASANGWRVRSPGHVRPRGPSSAGQQAGRGAAEDP